MNRENGAPGRPAPPILIRQRQEPPITQAELEAVVSAFDFVAKALRRFEAIVESEERPELMVERGPLGLGSLLTSGSADMLSDDFCSILTGWEQGERARKSRQLKTQEINRRMAGLSPAPNRNG
jgi:hypothetical protein